MRQWMIFSASVLIAGVFSGCLEENRDAFPDFPVPPDSPVVPDHSGDDPETPEMPPELPELPSDGMHRVTVATYNVHRLFDVRCDSGKCGPGDYEPQPTEAEYAEKIEAVAGGILKLNADVILLQEIEKESGISDLSRRLENVGYVSYAFGECGYASSVDVAILTRGFVTGTLKYRSGFSYTDPSGAKKNLSRELLAAEITLPDGIGMTAFTTHFISRVTDHYGDRRRAEAVYTHQAVSEYIDAHPGRFVVFGGDLNDTPGTASLQALENDGALVRDTKDMPEADIRTWNNRAAFDHIYHGAEYSPNLVSTEVVCDDRSRRGLGGSDHCALKSTYIF